MGSVLEAAEADLGPLKVDEDGDRLPGDLGGLAHASDAFRVLRLGAGGGIDACDVHSRLREGEDLFLRLSRRSEGAYNLRSTHRNRLPERTLFGYGNTHGVSDTSPDFTGEGRELAPRRYASTDAAAPRARR